MREFILVGGLAMLAGSASGATYFTFDDPSTGLEVSVSNSVMTYDTDALVDLVVDGTEDGYGILNYDDITFTKTTNIGVVTQIGNMFMAPASGEFAFFNGQELILSGSYQNATVVVAGSAGGIFDSGEIIGGTLSYIAHGSLLAALQGAFGANAQYQSIDGSWTLTAITNLAVDDGEFVDFQANAAFTGTANVVPTPGAVALAGIAGLAMARRRRA